MTYDELLLEEEALEEADMADEVPSDEAISSAVSAPETSDIPVMFLTGKGNKDSIMKVLSLKPAGYLLKTIERAKLRENIANFFMKQNANL